MTNAALGALTGLSESGASRLRNGDRRPSWLTLNRVAQAFDWPAREQFDVWNREGGVGYSAALAARIIDFEKQQLAAAAAS